MTARSDESDIERARRVRQALSGVGADALGAGLIDLDGVGDVTVDGRTVQIEVSLPVPHEATRAALEREMGDAATAVRGVTGVDVAWTPSAADPGERIDAVPDVKNVVAVASGKGGVGKSTVASNVAAALADAGADVGLLDADVYGPNAPTMLGISEASPGTTLDDRIVPPELYGVRVMSMDFVVGEDDPVIWRGSMVDDLLKQFFDDVDWGPLDYLVVDLPPGTGDAQLTLLQYLPVAGAVVVTTPQQVAVDDAQSGLVQFTRYDVPVLGVVENMAGFECPDCGEVHDIFGAGGADDLAASFDVPVLGRLPIETAVSTPGEGDAGSRGVQLPVLGEISLPRTREERERAANPPPVAIRDDAPETAAAARSLATRIAARVNVEAVGD